MSHPLEWDFRYSWIRQSEALLFLKKRHPTSRHPPLKNYSPCILIALHFVLEEKYMYFISFRRNYLIPSWTKTDSSSNRFFLWDIYCTSLTLGLLDIPCLPLTSVNDHICAYQQVISRLVVILFPHDLIISSLSVALFVVMADKSTLYLICL